MGLFACKSSEFVFEMIEECSRLHAKGQGEKLRYSDDDAITDFFMRNPHRARIVKLPQASFPVGNLLNLFLPFSFLRGLRPSTPNIFHANYVVGEKRKIALLRFIDFRFDQSFSKFIGFTREYFFVIIDVIVKLAQKPFSNLERSK